MKEKTWTIPNLLSGYRIVMFPVLFWLIWTRQERPFAILLIVNLLTDIADGWIARRFNMQTKLGARLDSTADDLTYVAAFYGLWTFKWAEIGPHRWGLALFMGLFFAQIGFVLWKYGRIPGFHLWSFKATGYVQGAFFGVLFLWGFYPAFFWFAMLFGSAACVETIMVARLLDKPRTDVKGYFWVKKGL